MPIRLWHSAWPERFAPIQAEGFRGNQFGLVYFTRPGETLFQIIGHKTLEVALDLTEEELSGYEFGRVDGTRNVPFYMIPDSLVNERMKEIHAVS